MSVVYRDMIFRHVIASTAHTVFDSGNLQTTVQYFHQSGTGLRAWRMEQLIFMQ